MSFQPGLVAGFPRPAAPPPEPVSANWSDVALLISAGGATLGKYAGGNIADRPAIVQASGGLSAGAPFATSATSPFPGGTVFAMSDASNMRRWKVFGSQTKIYVGEFTLEGFAHATEWQGIDVPVVSAYLDTGTSWMLRKSGANMEFRYVDPGVVEHAANWTLPPAGAWFHW